MERSQQITLQRAYRVWARYHADSDNGDERVADFAGVGPEKAAHIETVGGADEVVAWSSSKELGPRELLGC